MSWTERGRERPFRPAPDTIKHYPLPAHWQAWFELYHIAPELCRMHSKVMRQVRPPRPLTDYRFVEFCACFADSKKREVLRALIFDLLADDLRQIL